MKLIFASLVPFLIASIAQAELSVEFIEGAPKDTFVISTSCDLPAGVLTLDMTRSAGGLIFDVTGQGAGVEVFQPLEIVSGSEWLREVSQVKDGDQTLSLALKAMPATASLIFTIDMDDTLGGREIKVSGSEIEGGEVRWEDEGQSKTAKFTSSSAATISTLKC